MIEEGTGSKKRRSKEKMSEGGTGSKKRRSKEKMSEGGTGSSKRRSKEKMSEGGTGSSKRRREDSGPRGLTSKVAGAADRSISDADVERSIRHALDNFDEDKFKAVMRDLFKSGFALGLYMRGEEVVSTASNETGGGFEEDGDDQDNDAALSAASTNDASEKVGKRRVRTVEKVAEKKNKVIMSHFGFGGLRVEKLVRSLNNALISQAATMENHMNLQW
jgi:hypothetical protein